jgi:hypothetical protein
MAATLAGARLTEAHRLAQARIGVQTAAQMVTAWSLIDPNRLDNTTPDWLRVSLTFLQNQRNQSTQLAAAYLRAFRQLELGELVPPARILFAGSLDIAAATTSLTVTGPVSVKRAMTAGSDLAEAAQTARANTARSGMRHALGGGRDTITATVEADRFALGYRRVTSGGACDFCSMLAGRGAVYSGRTSKFDAHDGCSCSSEPVYAD